MAERAYLTPGRGGYGVLVWDFSVCLSVCLFVCLSVCLSVLGGSPGWVGRPSRDPGTHPKRPTQGDPPHLVDANLIHIKNKKHVELHFTKQIYSKWYSIL